MFYKTINLDNAPKSTKVALFVLIFSAMLVGFLSMKNEAYDYSLEKVKGNEDVLFYLGSPIEAGYFVSGEVSNVETELNYSIQGPLNSADVYLYAKVKNGYWDIKELTVTVDGMNKLIDVTPTQ